MTKVVLPGSVPVIISNMKVNIGLCLVGVIIGEFLAARSGLGYLIIYSSQVFKMDWLLMNSSMSKSVELYQYVNCGNAVVNTSVNYEISRARSEGIRTESQIIIPKKLPYRETELCSLLFNLLNNAIEACCSPGIKDPFICLQMRQLRFLLLCMLQVLNLLFPV